MEKLVQCMKLPTVMLPDDRKWIYPQLDGKPTGWAQIPPSEVISIVGLVQYLTEQLNACYPAQNAKTRP